jgi:hypothetical protein
MTSDSILFSVKSYVIAVLKWWWIILFGYIFTILSAIPMFAEKIIIPSSVNVAFGLVGIFLAQFMAYHENRKALLTINRQILSHKKIEDVLKKLGELRTEGVNIRERGEKATNQKEIEQFMREVIDWKGKIITEIGSISTAEAEIFKTLDVLEIKCFKGAKTPEQQQYLCITTQYTRHLKDLIEKLAVQNIASQSTIA